MLLHSCKLSQMNYHNWFVFRLVGCPPAFPAGVCSSNGWKGTDATALPCYGIRSSARTQYSVSERCFIPLERGTAENLTCFHLPSSPEQFQNRKPDRAECGLIFWQQPAPGCHLSLGARAVTLCTRLCSAFLISFTGRVEDLGALGKVLSKKSAFGPKVSGNVLSEIIFFSGFVSQRVPWGLEFPTYNSWYKIIVPWLRLNDPVTWLCFSSVRD